MNKISRAVVTGAVAVVALAPATGALAASHASAHRPAAAGHGKAARPAKPLPAVAGTITAVDGAARTITVSRPAAHHPTKVQTVSVAANAKVTRNDAAATLAELQPGDHVSAKVSMVGGVLTASRVSAEAHEAETAG